MARLGLPIVASRRRRCSVTPTERSRRGRWQATGKAKVVHPNYGAVVVPHYSNLAAILNAAAVWGCDWLEIMDARVWAAPDDTPVSMPYII